MRILRKTAVTLLIFSFCISALYITASAGTIAYGAATVDATSLNMRSGPDTTYPIVKTIPHDEKIVILKKSSEEWYHAVYSGVEGYVASLYLKEVVTAENFKATGRLTGDDVFLRSGPSTSSSLMGSCDAGTQVNIIGINSGWYKVIYDDATGYIRSDFITLVADTPASAPSSSSAGTKSATESQQTSAGTIATTASAPQPSEEELSLRQQIVNFALQFVGGSYVYGGTSPSVGFDCSGLVYYVYHQFDYNITRTASSQYANDGTQVSKAELLPGDLVFFSSNGGYSVTHVGIYIGNSQFVHASTPKAGIVISDLDSSYYTGVWYGAKRVLS